MSDRRRTAAVQHLPARVLQVTAPRAQIVDVVGRELSARGYRLAQSDASHGDEHLTFHWSSPTREVIDDVLGISVLRSKLRGGPHGFGRVTVILSGAAPATVVTIALRQGVFHAATVREVIERILADFAAARTLTEAGTPISTVDLPPEMTG